MICIFISATGGQSRQDVQNLTADVTLLNIRTEHMEIGLNSPASLHSQFKPVLY